jgi:hypothetical protein
MSGFFLFTAEPGGSSLGIAGISDVIVSISQLVVRLTGWSAEMSRKAARKLSLGMRIMGIGGENDPLSLEMKIENTDSGRQMMAPITANSGETLRP